MAEEKVVTSKNLKFGISSFGSGSVKGKVKSSTHSVNRYVLCWFTSWGPNNTS